jgi:hypothetical protein
MPIYDSVKQQGAIDVGNTPGFPLTGTDYDDEVIALGPLWFSILSPAGAENPPIWLTYAEALVDGMYDWPGWGPFWVEAWVDEYLIPIDTEWPSYATGIADDVARTFGSYYFDAWYNWLSPQLSYDDMLDNEIGAIWSSRLSTTGVADPIGGTITDSGGYRYHTFLTGSAWPAFYVGTDITMSVDVLYLAGGAPGGRYSTGNAGGGGGAGEYFAIDGYSAVDVCEVRVGAAVTGLTVTNGNNTTFDGSTALGGGIGGHIGLSTVNGAAGGSGGGGTGTTTPASGTGGSGSAGGNNGGNGFGGATPSGGGGGGANVAGGNGTGSVGGAGGTGLTWHDGVAYAYGGGGARVSAPGSGGGVGGNGGSGTNGNGGNAVANRGSGGGGSRGTGTPGSGSAGIVKIRYPYP